MKKIISLLFVSVAFLSLPAQLAETNSVLIGMKILTTQRVGNPKFDGAVFSTPLPFDTAEAWEMHADPTLDGLPTGKLTLILQKELHYSTHVVVYSVGDHKAPLAKWFASNEVKLMPGLYDVVIDGRLTLKNVPIAKGQQTRLRMGVLEWDGYHAVSLKSADKQTFTYASPFSILLPQGQYQVVGSKKPVLIRIVERETVHR
jgi:hypothetical protein